MSSAEVLNQADALMRRHRSFVARDPQAPAPAEPESLPDIPLLTEKVDADDTLVSHADLAIAVGAELSRWFDEVLPTQIEQLKLEIDELLHARLEEELHSSLLPRLEAVLAEALARKR